jgi:CO/xanthine dehydrogenase Mo-binding subunit
LASNTSWFGLAAASMANATGKRLRDLPLTRKRIKDAIEA